MSTALQIKNVNFQHKRKKKCLTVILSSRSSMLTPSFFHEMVGSGCPRGGWHSSTAGSPAATITSAGFCLKSSRRTTREETQGQKMRNECDKFWCTHNTMWVQNRGGWLSIRSLYIQKQWQELCMCTYKIHINIDLPYWLRPDHWLITSSPKTDR